MTKFFKVFLSVLTISILAGCKISEQNYGYSVNATGAYQMSLDTFTVVQVDSMIRVDKLPKLVKWHNTTLTDYETQKNNVYYTLFDYSTNYIYTVKTLSNNQSFLVTKRRISSK